MKTVFYDSGFFIAVLSPKDQLHARAKEVYASLGPHQVLTSEMVLAEVLNSLSRLGALIRGAGVTVAKGLRANNQITVVPQTSFLFEQSLELYSARPDKAWSLTDCSSMVLLNEWKIAEVMTDDEHFVQAGYRALLRLP